MCKRWLQKNFIKCDIHVTTTVLPACSHIEKLISSSVTLEINRVDASIQQFNTHCRCCWNRNRCPLDRTALGPKQSGLIFLSFYFSVNPDTIVRSFFVNLRKVVFIKIHFFICWAFNSQYLFAFVVSHLSFRRAVILDSAFYFRFLNMADVISEISDNIA